MRSVQLGRVLRGDEHRRGLPPLRGDRCCPIVALTCAEHRIVVRVDDLDAGARACVTPGLTRIRALGSAARGAVTPLPGGFEREFAAAEKPQRAKSRARFRKEL